MLLWHKWAKWMWYQSRIGRTHSWCRAYGVPGSSTFNPNFWVTRMIRPKHWGSSCYSYGSLWKWCWSRATEVSPLHRWTDVGGPTPFRFWDTWHTRLLWNLFDSGAPRGSPFWRGEFRFCRSFGLPFSWRCNRPDDWSCFSCWSCLRGSFCNRDLSWRSYLTTCSGGDYGAKSWTLYNNNGFFWFHLT